MATDYSITRLVGCEHLLSIQQNISSGTPIPNSANPNTSLTGPGRPGKQRIAFILTNADLALTEENDAQIGFAIDSGIAFQNPSLDLSPTTTSAYTIDTPLDVSTFIPIMHVTPLLSDASLEPGDGFAAWLAQPYLVYNQSVTLASRLPGPASAETFETAFPGLQASPNGVLSFIFGTAVNVFVPTTLVVAGSFMIEIDFSHSIAS